MIISQEIEIKIVYNYILNHYKALGYKCELRVPFIVKTKHLRETDQVVIECKCEKCGDIVKRPYHTYLINKNNKYFSCSIKCTQDKIKATNLIKYGSISPFGSKEVQEKSKNTVKERYGVDNVFQLEEIKDTIKETLMDKHGVDNPMKSEEIRKKRKKTCLERYGVEHNMQSEEIRDKAKKTLINNYGVDHPMKSEEIRDKAKKTNLERYGVENAMQSEEIRDKAKKTCLERYGVEYALQVDEIRDKIKKTCLERYGVENAFQSIEIKNKIKEIYLGRYGTESYIQSEEYKNILLDKKKNKFINLLNISEEDIYNLDFDNISILCKNCNNIYTEKPHFLYKRIKRNLELCTNCLPYEPLFSQGEKEVLKAINDNYSNIIIENDRKILKGKELDVYLPEVNLAFEFNGVYWHSELFKDSVYHLNKTNNCLNENIQLIHIYEDDWNNKQDIVKSNISNLLGKLNKIHANKCVIKDVDVKEAKDFFDNNHINGYVNSSIRLGLYFNDKLVSLMTFKKLENTYKLLHFCDILNYSIIDGNIKIFNHFIKSYNPKEIISYMDRSWNLEKIYEKLGFNKEHETNPDYCYVIKGIRTNKHKIVIKREKVDSITVYKTLLNKNVYRLYDSGSIKFIWT